MRLKKGVHCEGVKPEAWYAIGFIDAMVRVYTAREAIITSLTDGKHSAGSLHPAGYAIDVRTRNMEPATQEKLWLTLRAALTPRGFDVVLELDHLHVEYDPKGERTFLAPKVL